jgi:hypothetical protein
MEESTHLAANKFISPWGKESPKDPMPAYTAQGEKFLASHMPELEKAGLPKGSYKFEYVKDPETWLPLVAIKPEAKMSPKTKDELSMYKHTKFISDRDNTVYLEPGKILSLSGAFNKKSFLVDMLDKIASTLESKGLIKEAERIDIISNTLEIQ